MTPEIVARLRRGEPLEALAERFHLFVNAWGPWVQLCYDSGRSPADSLLAGQCRGLVLHREEDWRPLCWGMDRFFHHRREEPAPLLAPLRAEEKEDGTYILLFCADDRWHAATRHTFCAQDTRYRDLLLRASGCPDLDALAARAGLSAEVTWCLELCSPENRVIRPYSAPALFLLAAYTLADHQPLSDEALDATAERSGGALRRPRVHGVVEDMAEAEALLARALEAEPLFEGLVVRDRGGQRQKLKSDRHRLLDRLKYRGWTQASPQVLAPFLLAPDRGAALLSWIEDLLPSDAVAEIAWRVDRYGEVIAEGQRSLAALWARIRDLPRREAAAIVLADPHPDARLLLRWQDRLRDGASFEEAFRREGARVVAPLFGDEWTSAVALAREGHPPERCPLPAEEGIPTGAGMAARPPEEDGEGGGWRAWCACGAEMELLRLKVARGGYLECHCGGRAGLHTYPAGVLLWACGACGCTHEAHQESRVLPEEGVAFTRGQPLGIPADRRGKALRLQLHEELAALRERQGWSRREVYRWLAGQVGLERDQAHVARFDVPMCVRAIRAARRARA